MKSYPFIRTKWSNEHIMAAVLLVLIFYHLPQWLDNPMSIISFFVLVIFGLVIDAIASIIRYKRMWCCVSGGVTAAMISLLTKDIPLWGKLIGVALALILGKHLFGGTGKNILNPAIIGVMLILPYFGIPEKFFSPSLLLLPAILLGLVFLKIRPYSGVGFMLGMILAMVIRQELTIDNIFAYGVFFWGCLVITDPVTVSPNPVVGGVMGLLAGSLPLLVTESPVMIVFGVLAINLFSKDLAKILEKSSSVILSPRMRIAKVFSDSITNIEMIDLTKDSYTIDNITKDNSTKDNFTNDINTNDYNTKTNTKYHNPITKELILERLKANEVFGMGGAAFSTHRKIESTMAADTPEKHLIINGVECDPGLIHDEWLIHNHFKEICKGVELLKHCIQFSTVTLAVKHREGLSEDHFRIHQVRDLYPVGAERVLIKEVLGKVIPMERIPAKEGILVLNIQTAYAISQSVLSNKKITTRYITVANLREKTAKVVKIDLGMKLQDIIEAVFPGAITILAGGGMMQARLVEEDAVTDPYVNFVATGMLPNYKESPQCSGCGNCSRNCPCSLPVKRIADFVDQKKLEETVKLRVKECISCGSCSYTCLAGNNLSAKVKYAKEAQADE